MSFTDVLKEIQGIEEADQTAFSSLYQKYPDLDKVFAPRAELSEAEKARKRAETNASKANETIKAWNDWQKENWIASEADPRFGMTKAHKETLEQMETIQRELLAARANGTGTGGTMDEGDFKSVLEYVKAQGNFITQDQLPLLATKAETDSQRTNVNNALVGFEAVYRNTSHLPARYYRELGSELGDEFNMGEYLDYINQDPSVRARDFNATYEQFIGPKKAALELKRKEKELEAKQKALDEKEQALKVQTSAAPNPSDTTGAGPSGLGHLQARLSKPKEEVDDKVKLGDGILAMRGVEKLNKGEYATTTVQ